MVLAQFDQAETIAFTHILEYLGHIDPSSAQAQAVAEALYDILKSEYDIKMSSEEFTNIIYKQTSAIYKDLARTDKLLPRVDFGLPDERAMKYLNNSDLVYLGKYINSDVLRARIVDYIRETYLQNGAAIGNSPKELRRFMDEFGNELALAKFKVRQIIDTTVSRARVFGQLNGMRAAGGKTFEVVGPDDNLTCPFCLEMLGRTFDVAAELQNLDRFTNAGPENANAVQPFLKGSLAIDDISDMSDAELQDEGFATPPYHPGCRHGLAVVSFYTDLSEVPYSVG